MFDTRLSNSRLIKDVFRRITMKNKTEYLAGVLQIFSSKTFRIFFLSIVVFGSSPALRSVGQEFKMVNVFRNGEGGYRIYRIPTIVKAANGDLLAFCEARSGGDLSEIDLVLKRSLDNGQSWQALDVVQDSNDFQNLFEGDAPEISVGNPSPVVDLLDPTNPGRIWLPFTLENDRVFVTYSDDHGISWAERREITDDVKRKEWGWYATGPVHSIQLTQGMNKGRLIIPCDHRIGSGGQDRGACGAHAMISDDHGKTWRIGAIDDTYSDSLNANETSVVELNDGRLLFNTRDQNGKAEGTRGQAFSDDGGESFVRDSKNDDEIFAPCDRILDPPVVQCALLRAELSDEGAKLNLILFSGPDENGPTGKCRSDLRIRYSTNEGKSWSDGPLIHEGPAAYSDLVRLGPGEYGVLFESGEKGNQTHDQITFGRFRLKDLRLETD